jgi:enoyl-CoA hydratase/carnithine racemase
VNAQSSVNATQTTERVLLREDRPGVTTLTLNRPKQLNALNSHLLDELEAELESIAQSHDVRVVVLAGVGAAFSPGHDLKEMMANRDDAFIGGLFERCANLMLTMARLPQPVVARVHGIATAAGCQFVAASDMAVASTDARFATSGINFGLFCSTPGVGVSRNILRKRAFEMLFTGEFINAHTALEWGLVNRVVAPNRLDEEIAAIARSIIEKPAGVIAAGKKFFYDQIELNMSQAYKAASAVITQNMLGPDAAEGVGAFLEKRKPKWRNG